MLPNELASALQSYLDDAVRANTAPHWAGCIIDSTERANFFYAGSSPSTLRSLRDDDIYAIASAGQILTSLTLLHAIEVGAIPGLSWPTCFDDPDALTNYLPEFKVGSDSGCMLIFEGWIGDPEERRPRLRKATKPVTLRHLLTWTAGGPSDAHDDDMALFSTANRDGVVLLPSHTSGHFASLLIPRKAEAGDPDSFVFAGPVRDWLGILIARGTGLTQGEAFQRFLVRPLGISARDMSFYYRDVGKHRRLPYHRRKGNGWMMLPIDFVRALSSSWALGQATHLEQPTYLLEDGPAPGHHEIGSIVALATLPAFAQVLQAVLTRDQRLLSPARWDYLMADDLARSFPSIRAPRIFCSGQTTPALAQDVILDQPDIGVSLLQTVVERHLTSYGTPPGTMSGYSMNNLTYWLDPSNGLAGIIATQTLPWWNEGAAETTRGFQRIVYEHLHT